MSFSLRFLAPAHRAGETIPIAPPEALLGSAPICQIVLAAPTVSRIHCRLVLEGDSVMVHDQASTNGTLIDGQLVSGSGELRDGQVLSVGGYFELLAQWDGSQSVIGRDARRRDESGDTAELYQRAIEHDEEAARQLYYRFLPRITQIARRSLGTQLKRVVEAEEVAQEVLVEALIEVAAYDFRKQGSFLAFLKHKLRNVICDHSRYWSAKKRSAERTVGLETDSAGEPHDRADHRLLASPEAIVSLDEQLDRMRRAMCRLSPEGRRLIQWARIEERPYEEIAQALDVTRDAVRMRVARAVAELQAIFDGLR